MLRHSLRQGSRCLLSTSASQTPTQRDALGIKLVQDKDASYRLKQEYAANPDLVRKMEGNGAARRVFSVEFGDASDEFNRDLYDLYSKVLEYRPATPPPATPPPATPPPATPPPATPPLDQHSGPATPPPATPPPDQHPGYCDVGLDPRSDPNIKSVVVNHLKMEYLSRKLPFDPAKLRGPQIKYHPHMEVVVLAQTEKNRRSREEVIWKANNYVRMKQADHARALGNRYDSYYVYKRERAQSKRLVYSRNNFFFRWVYYHADTIVPYELHGKEAAKMHRWTELREERDAKLREVELEDILKYRHVVNALQIKPVYIPTHKLPKPKWFRNNAISCLTAAEIARLRHKRAHGAITQAEEENVTIPARPTKFNELIPGWTMADQNVLVGSDFSFGQPVTKLDPVPLPSEPPRKALLSELVKRALISEPSS